MEKQYVPNPNYMYTPDLMHVPKSLTTWDEAVRTAVKENHWAKEVGAISAASTWIYEFKPRELDILEIVNPDWFFDSLLDHIYNETVWTDFESQGHYLDLDISSEARESPEGQALIAALRAYALKFVDNSTTEYIYTGMAIPVCLSKREPLGPAVSVNEYNAT